MTKPKPIRLTKAEIIERLAFNGAVDPASYDQSKLPKDYKLAANPYVKANLGLRVYLSKHTSLDPAARAMVACKIERIIKESEENV